MTELLDNNKTDLTHVATATAAAWMEAMGCKPVEAEVAVSPGWIADLAGVWCPTMTEAKNSHAMKHWPESLGLDRDSFSNHGLYERAMHQYGGRLLVAVEVKVSRSDFLKDVGRKYGLRSKRAGRPLPANLGVLAAPLSVFKDKDEHMEIRRAGWGYLQLSESCERVTSKKWAVPYRPNPMHPGEREDFLAGFIETLDHRTRHARLRHWLKSWRRQEKQDL